MIEGTVYREGTAWAFKICRSGCEELAQQGGFATRAEADASCRRALRDYDPNGRVLHHYVFESTLALTVEGDSLEEATAVADEEFRQISDALDRLWWERNGASSFSQALVRHGYEE